MNNKYNEAIGIFWGASFFFGVLSAIIAAIKKNVGIVAGAIGFCGFLISGLWIQGLITLLKKDSK